MKSKQKRQPRDAYPQSTFKTFLVKSVDRRKNLEELEDALRIVEVGNLFEGLLDQLPQCFCLRMEQAMRASMKVVSF